MMLKSVANQVEAALVETAVANYVRRSFQFHPAEHDIFFCMLG